MKNPFQFDGPLFVFLSKIGDMMLLNIMFLITCIPIITIGASLTSLYSTSRKCICDGEGYVLRCYWKTFITHFKKSTCVYLINILFAVFIFVDISCARTMAGTNTTKIVLEAFLFLMTFLMIFIMTLAYPYLSVADGSIIEIIKKSMWIAIVQLPITMMMMILNFGPWVYIFILGKIYLPMIGLYTLIGFALTATIESFFLKSTFKKIGLIQEN